MLWNRKFQYRVHKSPCLVSNLSKRNRVTPSHPFLIVHYHIILSSTPSSFKWSFPSLSHTKHCMYFYSSPCMLHTCPSHPSFIWSPSEAKNMKMCIPWRRLHRLVQRAPAQNTATSKTKGRSCQNGTESHSSDEQKLFGEGLLHANTHST